MKTRFVEVDQKFAKRIIVPRYDEGGYQRPLNQERALTMSIAFAEDGIPAPPILVADVRGELQCMDGQHRLHGKLHGRDFPLFAQITHMTRDAAAEAFCALNGKGRKVNLRHILKVNPKPVFKRIRKIAKQYGAGPEHVANLLRGISRSRAVNEMVPRPEQWVLLEEILKIWTKDERWKDPDSLFNSTAAMFFVGRMCVERFTPGVPVSRPKEMVKALLEIDFEKSGDWALYASTTVDKHMREWAEKNVLYLRKIAAQERKIAEERKTLGLKRRQALRTAR